MRFVGDLHIHSPYSRATSPDMSPEGLSRWASIKGIKVLGTGDFTHPGWFMELSSKLEPSEGGLYRLKKTLAPIDVPASCDPDVYFIPSAEISSIYKKNGKTRKIHNIILVPALEDAGAINKKLDSIGNIRSDGRPILGLGAEELARIALDICPSALVIPAHAWTPHFSVFGAFSGFNSLEECFGDMTKHIYAIETGLSSDPLMNRRLSHLDNITLISNSDAHSPSKLGREANVFDTDLSYKGIYDAIRTRKGFEGTIEFYPEEGKYHMDGHRACGISLEPAETKKHGGLCPVCGRKLTIGVMHRVDELADRPEGFMLEGAPGFRSIAPLQEIIGEAMDRGANTKSVSEAYFGLVNALGPEFHILLDAQLSDIETASTARIAEAVGKVRKRDIFIEPGYDGVFGVISVFGAIKRPPISEKSLKGKKKKTPSKKGQGGLF